MFLMNQESLYQGSMLPLKEHKLEHPQILMEIIQSPLLTMLFLLFPMLDFWDKKLRLLILTHLIFLWKWDQMNWKRLF